MSRKNLDAIMAGAKYRIDVIESRESICVNTVRDVVNDRLYYGADIDYIGIRGDYADEDDMITDLVLGLDGDPNMSAIVWDDDGDVYCRHGVAYVNTKHK